MINSENNRHSSPSSSLTSTDIYRNNNNNPPPPHLHQHISSSSSSRSSSPTLNIVAESGESNPSTSKWSCPLCTYLNWPRAQKCVQCLTARKKKISPTNSRSSPAGAQAASSSSSSNVCGTSSSSTFGANSLQQVQGGMDKLRINGGKTAQDSNNERNAAIIRTNNCITDQDESISVVS